MAAFPDRLNTNLKACRKSIGLLRKSSKKFIITGDMRVVVS